MNTWTEQPPSIPRQPFGLDETAIFERVSERLLDSFLLVTAARTRFIDPRDRGAVMSSSPESASPSLVMVGLGASAAGIAPLLCFFEAVPDDCGLTFVVVSHTDPDRPSLLPGLLQARSKLPASVIIDGEEPDIGHIYIPPSWAQVVLNNGAFRLHAFNSVRARSRRIDVFLRSMAHEMRKRCAGVVLSGCGSDGSEGVETIAANGGLTLAQPPLTALEPSMPSCAIATGSVRHIVEVRQMPAVIGQHFMALGVHG